MSSRQASAKAPSSDVIKMVASHTAAMVEGLPRDCFALGIPKAVQYAAIEGFYVNVRSLIEFLGVKGIRRRRDGVFADKIVTAWKPVSDQATVAKLKKHWVAASTHAAHFTRGRMTWNQVDQQELETVANDCCPALKMTTTPSLSMTMKMVVLVATLTG